MNAEIMLLQMQKTKTSHIGHLIMTIVMLLIATPIGIMWIGVWLMCEVHTSHVNYHVDRKIKAILKGAAQL
jgi:ABC-type phosphate transport system permease subunit